MSRSTSSSASLSRRIYKVEPPYLQGAVSGPSTLPMTGFAGGHVVCYPRRVANKPAAKPSITIVGPGNLGSALAIEPGPRAAIPFANRLPPNSSSVSAARALARRVKADTFFWASIRSTPILSGSPFPTTPSPKSHANWRRRSHGRARSCSIPAEP